MIKQLSRVEGSKDETRAVRPICVLVEGFGPRVNISESGSGCLWVAMSRAFGLLKVKSSWDRVASLGYIYIYSR